MARPKLDPAEKARRQAERKDRKAANELSSALARMPKSKEKRLELMHIKASIKAEQRRVAGEMQDHMRLLREDHGYTREALKIHETILKIPEGQREGILKQVGVLNSDMGISIQTSLMFDSMPDGVGEEVEPDNGPVFDGTATGKRQGSKLAANDPAAPPTTSAAPTLGLTEEQALAGFEEGKAAADAKKAAAEPLDPDPAANDAAPVGATVEATAPAKPRRNRSKKAETEAAPEKSIAQEMAEASAAGDAHIKAQIAARAQPDAQADHTPPPPPPPAPAAAAAPPPPPPTNDAYKVQRQRRAKPGEAQPSVH